MRMIPEYLLFFVRLLHFRASRPVSMRLLFADCEVILDSEKSECDAWFRWGKGERATQPRRQDRRLKCGSRTPKLFKSHLFRPVQTQLKVMNQALRGDNWFGIRNLRMPHPSGHHPECSHTGEENRSRRLQCFLELYEQFMKFFRCIKERRVRNGWRCSCRSGGSNGYRCGLMVALHVRRIRS